MAVKWSNELRWYLGTFDLTPATTRGGVTLQAPALDKTAFSDAAETSEADVRRDEAEWAGWFEDTARSVDALIGTVIGTSAQVVQFHVGTGTGARAYCGDVFVAAAKPSGRVGELVRVEADFKPDFGTGLRPAKHFGPKASYAADGNSGSIDEAAASPSGTTTFFVNVFNVPAGTLTIAFQDSADGTTFAVVGSANYAAAVSTALTYTGTVRRYVRVGVTSVGATGTGTFAAAYERPR